MSNDVQRYLERQDMVVISVREPSYLLMFTNGSGRTYEAWIRAENTSEASLELNKLAQEYAF